MKLIGITGGVGAGKDPGAFLSGFSLQLPWQISGLPADDGNDKNITAKLPGQRYYAAR